MCVARQLHRRPTSPAWHHCGNGIDGVHLGSSNNTIGACAGAGNLISANQGLGLFIARNIDGQRRAGQRDRNRRDRTAPPAQYRRGNRRCHRGLEHSTIEGTAPGAGNRIAFSWPMSVCSWRMPRATPSCPTPSSPTPSWGSIWPEGTEDAERHDRQRRRRCRPGCQ